MTGRKMSVLTACILTIVCGGLIFMIWANTGNKNLRAEEGEVEAIVTFGDEEKPEGPNKNKEASVSKINSLNIEVVDPSGVPIRNSAIEIRHLSSQPRDYQAPISNDPQGDFTFLLPNGRFRAIFSAPKYATDSVQVNMDGKTVNMTLKMVAGCGMLGRIVNGEAGGEFNIIVHAEGAPLVGHVERSMAPIPELLAKTYKNGHFVIDTLRAGKKRVQFIRSRAGLTEVGEWDSKLLQRGEIDRAEWASLEIGENSLSGGVLSPDGDTAQATITVTSKEWPKSAFIVRTDKLGIFEVIGLPDGKVTLEVTPNDFRFEKRTIATDGQGEVECTLKSKTKKTADRP